MARFNSRRYFCPSTVTSRSRCLALQIGLGLPDGVPGVVFGGWFVFSAKVRNPLNNLFWVVSTGQGTFGIGPVMLRLAQYGSRNAAPAAGFLVAVSRCFL